MKNQISSFAFILFMFSSILMFGQTRDIGDFHAIKASTSVDVTLVKSNETKIEFTMREGDEKQLITEVKNGVLHVKTKSKSKFKSNNSSADVTVYFTELDKVSASAGSTIKTKDVIKADKMDIKVSSGATAKLEVDAASVDVDVSSGATLKLKGEASTGKFEASSGATLNAYRFETEDAVAEASSGATVSLHVNDTLDAEAGSGGSINYTGDVKNKKIDAGWSGSITRKN